MHYSVRTAHPMYFNQLWAETDPIQVLGEWMATTMNHTMYTFEVTASRLLRNAAKSLLQRRLCSFGEPFLCAPGIVGCFWVEPTSARTGVSVQCSYRAIVCCSPQVAGPFLLMEEAIKTEMRRMIGGWVQYSCTPLQTMCACNLICMCFGLELELGVGERDTVRYVGRAVACSSPCGSSSSHGRRHSVMSCEAPSVCIISCHSCVHGLGFAGWPNGAGTGIMCPGGSMANLHAISLARHSKFPETKRTGVDVPLVLPL